MAPKAKGKKEKPNESLDERMARLEKEAYEAQEKAKVALEANRAALSDRQAREQQYSHYNAIKIHNQWRKIMRMTAVDQLRGQIEILSQGHEREVDRKDAIVQMLDRDLEDAEEQHGMALRGNMRVVQQLVDLQYQRMQAQEADFEAQLASLEGEFEAERADIATTHGKQRKDMSEIMAAMQAAFHELESEVRQEFDAQREEIKNKSSEDYNVMKITLESSISELEKKFEVSHDAYLLQTADHSATFKELTKTDAKAARVIEMRMLKLQRLQESLTHWRAKIQSNAREWEDRNASLAREKGVMSQHYQALKGRMDGFRAALAERLKQLSAAAQGAEGALRARLAKAESLLKLAERCRRLETEQEKILPFHSISEAVALPGEAAPVAAVDAEVAVLRAQEADAQREQQAQARAEGEGAAGGGPGGAPAAVAPAAVNVGEVCHGVDAAGEPVAEWDALEGFFRRFNKALLDKVAVDREAARLAQENDDLRAILKQYLDGISVNEAVMSNPINPLLVVNNRLQLTLRERDSARAVALQAAAVPQLVHST